jgi:hypothetical protein
VTRALPTPSLRRTARLLAAASLVGGSAVAAGCRILPAPAADTGWRALFDGRSLAGWRGYRQASAPGGWQAVGGALVRVGDGGDLVTTETFDDFELAFDWQIAAGGNSGVMFHVSEAFEAPHHTGPEYQLIDDDGHPNGRLAETSAGSNFALHAPARHVARAAGGWNESRLVVRGATVEHWLNGVRIVRYARWDDEWRARVAISKFNEWPSYGLERRGHLVLQNHGARVSFRNIWIRRATGGS